MIPVFFATDENYAPYLAIALRSLKDNASENYSYGIHVLHTGISDRTARRIERMSDGNFSIKFVDVSEKLNDLADGLHLRDYYTFTTYYRIFISELFPEYDKALYLDSDIILNGDISELFAYDLGDNLVGAVTDETVQGVEPFRRYVKKALGIEPERYFNAGVLLMNLKKFREEDFFGRFNHLLKKYKFKVAQDQDYLNVLCKNRVLYLGGEWNDMPVPDKTPTEKPKLIHYNLTRKPWHHAGVLYEEYFWRYAEKTDYYDDAKAELITYTDEKKIKDAECEKRLVSMAEKEAESDCNYYSLFGAEDDRRIRILNALSPERRAIYYRLEKFERQRRFDEDVENDPPTLPLDPEKVDYLGEKLSSKIFTKVAYFAGYRFFEGLIKKGYFTVERIEGEENLEVLKTSGAILACNHFAFYDNYAVYLAVKKYLKKGRLYKIIREGNYTSFKGLFGFLFRHCDTLPLCSGVAGTKKLMNAVNVLLKRGECVLIYPEQAMWWYYRKPRPFKTGGFRMAYKAEKPVITLFITMKDSDNTLPDGHPAQILTIYILPPVYPDTSLPQKEAIEKMTRESFEMCRGKYEEVYGKEYDL